MMASTDTDQQAMKKPALSKRQRRAQGPNPTNTWQQQPRIKSAGARARAYISYAGLNDEADAKEAEAAAAAVTKKTSSSNYESKTSAQDLLNPQLSLHSPEVKFGRLLGGTDQRSRHAAVKMLREYLRSKSDFTNGGTGLSELDLLKLWKGLWYTLYMADKQPVQDKLSKILAELMWCLSGSEEEDEYAGQVYLQMENGTLESKEGDEIEGEDYEVCDGDEDGFGGVIEDVDGDTMEIIAMSNGASDEDEDAMEEEDDEEDEEQQRIKDMNETHCRGAHLVSLYISTFLRTVRREWGNVDKHRVDKFYTAVRFMVSEAYKYMAKRHWNLGIIRLFNDVLYSEGLSADTPNLTNGLRYHLIDICVDELAKVNKDAELPLTEATFLDCLEPFFALAQRAGDKNVQKRVMDNVLKKFLNQYSFVCATAVDDDADEDDKALVFNQIHVGTVSKFIFEVASDPDTDERFRKSLYDMHKTYVRQIRAAGTDVDLDAEDEEDCCASNTCDLDQDGKCEKMQDVVEEETPEEKDVEEASNEQDYAKMVEETTREMKKEKKQKKKKKKADKKSAKDENEAQETPKASEESTTSKPKSSKKKKNKKDKGNNEVAKEDDVHDVAPETPEATEEAPSTPKSKSSKKKRKNQDTDDTSDLITTHVETPTPKSKKKNKKQKQQLNSPPSVDPRSMNSPDQVISPNTSDNDETGHGSDFSASKRVSFGKMNHCKSWKASMKAMKTLDKDTWDTVNRTPDKSILRRKEKERAAAADAAKASSSSDKKKKKNSSKPPLGPSSKKRKGKKSS